MDALVLQFGKTAPGAAFPDVEWLVDQGWSVRLLVTALSEGTVPPRVADLVELADAEQITVLWRAERFFVLTVPPVALRAVRKLVVALDGFRGVRRVTRRLLPAIARLQAFQARASRAVHARWHRTPYRVIRAWWMWRLVRRVALPELVTPAPRLVVCADRDSVTTAWHLARLLPAADVTYGVNRIRLADVGVSGPAAAPASRPAVPA